MIIFSKNKTGSNSNYYKTDTYGRNNLIVLVKKKFKVNLLHIFIVNQKLIKNSPLPLITVKNPIFVLVFYTVIEFVFSDVFGLVV